jgi:5-methylcytosine-specific restriction endonuclease McrA
MQEKITWRRWRRDNGHPRRCFNCGKLVHYNKKGAKCVNDDTATLDHIIPRSYIEEHELYELLFDTDNYTLLCSGCNLKKGHKFLPIMPKRLCIKLETAKDRARIELSQEKEKPLVD